MGSVSTSDVGSEVCCELVSVDWVFDSSDAESILLPQAKIHRNIESIGPPVVMTFYI